MPVADVSELKGPGEVPLDEYFDELEAERRRLARRKTGLKRF